MGQQTYTSGSGNFIVPNGVTAINWLLIGGGGGGCSAGGGGAGGGGGSRSRTNYGVTPGASIFYSIGAGGAADSNGGDSEFDGLTAGGGQGSSGATGGAGGTGDYTGGNGGDVVEGVGGGGSGSGGRSANGNNGSDGGAGGSAVSEGGAGGAGDSGSGPGNGSAPGGGGGGSATMTTGGTGGAGYLQINWDDLPPGCAYIKANQPFGTGAELTMKKNTSGQKIGAQMVSASDGSEFTGAVTVYVTGDAGTQAAGSVGSGACDHEGHGYHTYAPSQAETNYDLIAFTFVGAGAVTVTIQVSTTADVHVVSYASGQAPLQPTTAGRTLDVSTGGEAGIDWANVGSPTTTVSLSGTTVKTATDVETDTADIQARLPASLVSGRMDAAVGAMAADVLTATAIAADAITAAKVAADVTTELQSGLATAANLATANAVLAKLDDTLEDDVGTYRFTAAALAQGPTGGGLDAAGVRAAVGLAAANLDTQLTAIDDFLDTEIAAIKAKTDNLPASPAATSDCITAAGVRTAVGLASANLDTQLGMLATSSALTTVEGKIDTIDGVADAILVDTAEIGAAGAGLTALASAANLATANTALAKLDDTVEDNAGTYRFTAAALTQAPTGGGGSGPTAIEIADEVETRTIAGVTLVGTTTNLTNAPANGDLTATMKASVTTAATAATPTVTAGTVSDKTGYSLSASGIQAIWDALTSALTTVGSIGKSLVTLVTDYTTARAAKIDNLDAAVSTRMATFSYTTPPTVAAIRQEIDSNSTQLAAIVADTNELQSDWADGGRLDLILDARASQSSVDDLPTNAELATALGANDDATLAAIAGLNNLSAAEVRTELATELSRIDAAVSTRATPAQVASALATYDGPTNAEMVAAFTEIKGATWSATDTLEAIRDRGDAAWTTATGFSTHSEADVWAFGSRVLTAGTNIVLAKGTGITGFNDLSTAQVNAEVDTAIGDAALATAANLALVKAETAAIVADTNELQSDWADSGRLDSILDARASQTSVNNVQSVVDEILTDTAVIGVAGAGLTALASQASVNTIDDFLDTEISAIKSKTDQLTFTVPNQVDANALIGGASSLDAAGVRAAVGLAAANLDTQLGTLDDFLDTEIAAIKAKTDNLPADPADASDVASSFATVNSNLATLAAYVDTEVAAIKTVTEQLATTLELSGSAYRFTVSALELGPSGPLGPGTVYVYPLSSTLPAQTVVSAGSTQAFRYTPLPSGPIAIFDANGDPVDLTGVVLKMIATNTTRPDDMFALTSAAGELTAGGVDGNQVSIDYTPTTEGDYEWKLYRQEINPNDWTVLAFGFWNIADGEDPGA